jgi:hypothetical protein
MKRKPGSGLNYKPERQTMRKNVLRMMAVFLFNLIILPGCFFMNQAECDKFPGSSSCPPLPPAKETPKRLGYAQSPYREIGKSWQGRHINELFKSWGKDFYMGVGKCPHKICEGYPDSVASVYNWYAEGRARVVENPLDFLFATWYDQIKCTTEFAVDDKGRIIAIGLAFHGRGSIKKCDELIRTKQWYPTPMAAPGWFDEE